MNVLSLFDGMSCGQQALERAGIKVDNYFASEIDKHAIKVTMHNYPNTIQLGSVTDVDGYSLPKIDLLIGGSPCQSFSFAGKRKGMSTKDEQEILTLEHYLQLKAEGYEFEGQSYLFWEYMRLLKEVKPTYFLLENVMMGEKWEKVLSKAIGVNPIEINSALVSAQNRRRLYWTNIGHVPGGLFGDLVCTIKQPKDRGILLKDILESEVDEKYYLSEKMIEGFTKHAKRHEERGTGFAWNPTDGNNKGSCLRANAALCPTDNIIYTKIDKQGNIKNNQDKASCFTAGGHSGGNHSDMDLIIVHNTMPRSSTTGRDGTGPLSRIDGKTYCLDTGSTNAVEIASLNKNQLNKLNKNVNTDKCNTLTLAQGRAGSSDEYMDSVSKIYKITNRIRRLTPIECERLQTVADNEISCIFELCLDQAKNYVNVVYQNPKLLKLVLNAEKTELNEIVKSVLLNMNVSHQSIKHTVRQNADMRTQKEIKRCTNLSQEEKNIIVSNVENIAMCNIQTERVDSAEQNVFINLIEGKITHFGVGGLRLKDNHLQEQKNGKIALKLFGKEIMLVAEDVEKNLNTKNINNSIYTTLFLSNTRSLEQALIIYYLFAKNAITGFTQNTIQIKSLLLNFNMVDGYTSIVSDSQRYKILGNGWTVEVIKHIFSYINNKTK